MGGVCEHGLAVLPAGEPWPAGATPHCRVCWVRGRGAVPANRGRCLHLGARVEYRAGCGGWRCRHECEAGEPEAVPGGNCQTCPKWEGE